MKKNEVSETKQVMLMLAYLCVKSEQETSLLQKVKILDVFSLSDEDIASICKCGAQSVRNARQQLKRKK